MKKKLGISLMLMLGLLLVGCADGEGYESGDGEGYAGGGATLSAGSGGQENQNTNQSTDSQQAGESELGLLDQKGNLGGTIVSIQNNQMIIAPVMYAEIEGEDTAADFAGDESDWITVMINEDTTFIRDHIAQGVSQGSEPTTFNDLFFDDSVRIAGELTGNTVVATEVTVLVITH